MLDLRVEWRTRDLQRKVAEAAEPVSAMAAFVSSHQSDLSADSFQRFATQLTTQFPLLRTLAWAPYVRLDERSDFERLASQVTGEAFRIQERASGNLVEATPRDAYLTILFARSFVPGLAIPAGIDLLSQSPIRPAILRARDDGRTNATSPSMSRVSPAPELVFSVFVPVYSGAEQPSDMEKRRAAWRGSVVGSFGVSAVFSEALIDTPPLISDLYVLGDASAGKGPSDKPVLFAVTSQPRSFTRIDTVPSQSADAALRVERHFVALGRSWTLVFDFPHAAVRELRRGLGWMLPAVVLVLTALILWVLKREQFHTVRAEHLVKSRTEELATLLDAIPAYVWIAADPACRHVSGNRAANEMIRIAAESNLSYSTVEKDKAAPIRLLKEDGREFKPDEMPLRKAIALGREVRNEAVDFRFADGRRIEVFGNAAPLFDSGGRPRGAVSAFIDITERKRAEERLRESMDRVSMLSDRIVKAQEAERHMLAHELHDEIGQAMTAVKIRLQAIEPLSESIACPALTEHLNAALLAATQALAQVRSMSLDLRPLQLSDLGLAAALRGLVERQAAVAGWKVRFEENVGPLRLKPELEIACFRVTQEALTNVMRHAGADEVWIALKCSGEELRLTVRDDGTGFDMEAARREGAKSLGLIGMEERTRMAGGRFTIDTAPLAGTEINAVFPISALEREEAGGDAADTHTPS